jgi:outer membrane lipoprotein-sorting protein
MLSLIAAFALLQQETAEQAFARLEQALEKAKSVKIKGKLQLAQGGREMTLNTTLLLKAGNKAKIAISGAKGDPWSISDGKKVTVDAMQARLDGAEWETPKDLNACVSAAMARKGFLDLTELPRRIRVYGTNPKEKLQLSDFKFGEKDGELQTLTYSLQEGNGRAEITLWFEPKSLTLKKRTMVVAVTPQATVTETYDVFALNEEVPDESFKP